MSARQHPGDHGLSIPDVRIASIDAIVQVHGARDETPEHSPREGQVAQRLGLGGRRHEQFVQILTHLQGLVEQGPGPGEFALPQRQGAQVGQGQGQLGMAGRIAFLAIRGLANRQRLLIILLGLVVASLGRENMGPVVENLGQVAMALGIEAPRHLQRPFVVLARFRELTPLLREDPEVDQDLEYPDVPAGISGLGIKRFVHGERPQVIPLCVIETALILEDSSQVVQGACEIVMALRILVARIQPLVHLQGPLEVDPRLPRISSDR